MPDRTRRSHPQLTVGDLRQFINGGRWPTSSRELLYLEVGGRRFEVVKLERTFPGPRDVVFGIRDTELFTMIAELGRAPRC